MDEEEAKRRYAQVASTGVCPDCGSDVEKSTLREVLKRIEEKPEPDEDPDAVAYACTHANCKYTICIGERAA